MDGWLICCAVPTHQEELIFHLRLRTGRVIWKDRDSLTVISTESLKEVYQSWQKMAANNYELLRNLPFIRRTCCRAAENWEQYWVLESDSVSPFKPSGYAWQALFAFVRAERQSSGMDVWFPPSLRYWIPGPNTWIMPNQEIPAWRGEIGVFLFQKYIDDKDLRYTLKRRCRKLQDVLVNSAWWFRNP